MVEELSDTFLKDIALSFPYMGQRKQISRISIRPQHVKPKQRIYFYKRWIECRINRNRWYGIIRYNYS